MASRKAPLTDDQTTRGVRPGPAPSAHAVAVWSPEGTFVHALPERGEVTVGRGSDCEIRVVDDSVSRRHARLVVHSRTEVLLEDLGSRNGTRIHGQALVAGSPARLAVGATAELGDITLVLQRATPGLLAAHREDAPPIPSVRRPESAGVIVADPSMRRLYDLADVVAPTDVPVLVLGETGTGKEVYAQTIHARSGRKGALVSLNCAALAEAMLEGELFGYERGAFTGAVAAKPGLFEAADGGTIFLDEIGEMSLATQAKALRVIETGDVLRLGATKPRHVDVRLVSATNRDLGARVQDGSFRADLYFRLDGFTITLPPLRARPADVVALTDHFVALAAKKFGHAPPPIAESARRALAAHPWPGNARELRNVLQRAVLLAQGGEVTVSHLVFGGSLAAVAPPAAAPASQDALPTGESADLRGQIGAFEKQRILAALEACNGNQGQAAKRLGISRGTLLAKLDEHAIARPRKGR